MRKGKQKSNGGRGLFPQATSRVVWYSSLVLLGVIGLALLFPVAGSSSSALGEDITLTSNLNTKTTAYLYSTIALSTSGEVDINLIPKSNGSVEVGTADVTVSTNNTTGYSILLSTVDQTNTLGQKDKNAQYVGSNDNYAIKALGGKVTKANYLSNPANFNTWGYALTTEEANDNTEYQGLAASSGEIVYSTDGTSSRDRYKLNIAVAVDTSLPAGEYQNGLVVTAVANPIILSGFNQIYYMQDMTSSVCESAEMESTARLVDKRNNKIYWVAKLKDGNCWMTQNLALDLSADKALTPDDSDVTAEWVPTSSTETEIPVKAESNPSSERSWNLGNVVLTNPTTSTQCDNMTNDTEITSCQWYEDVDGWKAGYEATETSSIDSNSQSYDAHYLIGNYYTFGTATAGSGNGIVSPSSASTNPNDLVNAAASICPSGWKLPVTGRNTRNTAGWPFDLEDSFYRLLRAYGYPETGNLSNLDSSAEGWHIGNGNGSTNLINPKATRVDYQPIYFVRTGYLSPSSGLLQASGNGGYYRSSTAMVNSPSSALYLGFANNLITPAGAPTRDNGYPVRCLAR